MTDPRNLIQRLADTMARCEVNHRLLDEAYAYLAQPEPEGATDEELWLVGDDAFRCNIWPTDAIKYARAVLARYGNRTPAPIPLSERQPTEADCDAEGMCWFYEHEMWMLDTWQGNYTHWLPCWALSVPGQEVSK